MNVICLFRPAVDKAQNTQYLEPYQVHSESHLYIGTGLVPLGLKALNIPATLHLGYFDGTTYSV
jgi:hypothetical protein